MKIRLAAITAGYVAASCGPCQLAIGPVILVKLIATKVINKKIKTLESKAKIANVVDYSTKVNKLKKLNKNINTLFAMNVMGCIPVVGPLYVVANAIKGSKSPRAV